MIDVADGFLDDIVSAVARVKFFDAAKNAFIHTYQFQLDNFTVESDINNTL